MGRDLLAMVLLNRLDVTDILAKGELHLEADDIQGLMGLLNDYVAQIMPADCSPFSGSCIRIFAHLALTASLKEP